MRTSVNRFLLSSLKILMLFLSPIPLSLLKFVPDERWRIYLYAWTSISLLFVLVMSSVVARSKLVAAGLILLYPMIACATVASIFPRYFSAEINSIFFDRVIPPNYIHILGTDFTGRDILHSVILGGGNTYHMAFYSTCVATILGVLAGVLLVSNNHIVKIVANSLVEVFEIFPWLFLLILVVGVLNMRSQQSVFFLSEETRTAAVALAIGLSCIPVIARLLQRLIESLCEKEFVKTLLASGVSRTKVFVYNIIWKNVFPDLLMQVSFLFGLTVIIDSSLDFMMEIGFGDYGKGGYISWGTLLADARQSAIFGKDLWIVLVPGIGVVFTILGTNLIGEGLALEHKVRD